MQTLSLIGGGKVGQTLAKLWQHSGVFSLGQILNRSITSAQAAQNFMGAGCAVENIAALNAADIWLITTPDYAITDLCEQLSASGVLRKGDVVLHCSGALTSAHLNSAKNAQAFIGSLHPIKSFVDAATAVQTFAGTFCTFEGDPEASAIIAPAINTINGMVMPLTADNKALYHAGNTIVCNYLCALMEMGLNALTAAGLEPALARQAIAPMVRETLENILARGSVGALTGPIARGDAATLQKQSAAINAQLPQASAAFNSLAVLTTDLAELKGHATTQQLQAMRKFLSDAKSH